MEEKTLLFKIGPIWFDGTICLMVLLTCIIVFGLVYFCTRNIQLKPQGKQNVIEYLIDFVRGIITDNMPSKEVTNFHLLAFTMFLFVLVANIIGLVTKVAIGDYTYWKSPTADPIVTLTLALIMIVLTHFFSVSRFGLKGYFKNSFLSPVAFLMPIKIMEEFTNLLTLALRLYGNIFAGEVLLGLIAGLVSSIGLWTIPLAIPLEMIWLTFSLFIGVIQAFIFVTLSMVYMAHKVEVEE